MDDLDEKSWSWWTGYNYGNEHISVRASKETDFWDGLGDYAIKRPKQLKAERLMVKHVMV